MKLSVLIEAIKEKVIQGGLNIDIFGLDSDSRKIEKGHLFVAVKGTANDGHEYINKAIEQGATAVVCEDMPSQMEDSVTYIQVKNSADALGKLAAQWYGNPSDRLTLVGVTGTNGKTTIATLLYDLFRKLGYKTGLLSTVCNYVDDKAVPATHTTPDPISLNMLLAEMVEAGCTHAFMEVSSHSVDQKRISGLNFDGGIFTNLTRDHLDYHKTVDAYLKAKKGFFDQLPKSAFALTNLDDKSGMVMLQNTAARKLTYSLRSLADFKGRILEKLFEGTLLEVNGTEVMVHFVGKFNAYNLLAVYGAAVALGEEPNEVLLQIS
ncbi:MAG: UDP-N-acetylmuramoyl-L-alanyl-D-glutamate--2,6-diaminopimelate ligase, partial [Tannerellaceae bacterium]